MWYILVLCITLLCTQVNAATYYVAIGGSGSTCSQGSPCGSVNTGISKLGAGDTLYIRGGTYDSVLIDSSVQSIASGTDFGTGAVTIAGFPGETVTFLNNSNIRFPGSNPVSYIIIQNIHINCNGTECQLFFIAPTHHVRFDHVEMANSTTSSNGAGMITGNAPYMEFLYMDVHGAGWDNCSVYSNQGCYGFYINGHHLLMDHCDVHDNGGSGAQVYHSGAFDMTDNVIRNNRFYNNGYNDARGSAGVGVNIASGVRNIAYNNISWGNKGTGLSIYYGCDGCEAYNNTVVSNVGYGIEVTGAVGAIVKNNIIIDNSDKAQQSQFVDNSGSAVGGSSNMLSGSLSSTFTDAANHVYTLVSGSAAIDSGVTLASVPLDRDNVVRPQGAAYDKGAYEFGSSLPAPSVIYVAQTGGDDTRSCNTASVATTPLLTITQAMWCLTLNNSTMYIKTGTYVETIDTQIRYIPSGNSWAQPTTIQAFGNDVVTIRLPSNKQTLVLLQNTSTDRYIVFDRLILDCNNITSSNAFVGYPGTDHIRFQNGEMKNCNFEQVFLYDANNYEFLNSKFYGGTGWYAIAIYNTITGTIIDNNDIYNNWRGGIDLLKGTNSTISNTKITRNRIHTNSRNFVTAYPAIHLGGISNITNQVYNNIIYEEQIGIQVEAGADTSKIYGNTVYGSVGIGVEIKTGALDTQLKNNIMYGNLTNLSNSGSGTVQVTNMTSDPLFVNPGGGNFNVDSASTAIDTGTNVTEYAVDNIGTTRPQRTVYTIGAIEFIGTPNQPPPPPPPSGLVRVGTQWMTRGFMGK